MTQINAATIPAAPPRPTYSSSTDTTISLSFGLSTDNGGSKIIRYYLYRDGGDLSTPITYRDDTYDGVSSIHTIPGLTSGKKYRI